LEDSNFENNDKSENVFFTKYNYKKLSNVLEKIEVITKVVDERFSHIELLVMLLLLNAIFKIF